MTVCVVGAGGREHALARSLARTDDVIVTPGNPGMSGETDEGFHISVSSAPAEEIDAALVVIGPEAPLVDGLADRLRASGRLVFGPGADGARLEGSKAFMKEVLAQAGVPTARFGAFDRVDDARAFLRSLPGPWVVKTDGLASGKGVLVTDSLAEAEGDAEEKLSGRAFAGAGRRIVIEEGLRGPECSLMVLCDGIRVLPFPPAQDFKRLGDGDAGPNTGGMGSYSPGPPEAESLVDTLIETAIEPLVHTLRARGIDYRGALYAGLMLTEDGPKVLEFNVRFGDPETQVLLPRLAGDTVALLTAAASGQLDAADDRVAVVRESAICVVLAAPGYPEAPRTGMAITGLGDDGQLVDPLPGVTVYHASTSRNESGPDFAVAGGRVLGVGALGDDIDNARRRAYAGVERISWEGMQVRHDIAASVGQTA